MFLPVVLFWFIMLLLHLCRSVRQSFFQIDVDGHKTGPTSSAHWRHSSKLVSIVGIITMTTCRLFETALRIANLTSLSAFSVPGAEMQNHYWGNWGYDSYFIRKIFPQSQTERRWESTHNRVNQRSKDFTQSQQQRHACKYKVHKLHQRYILERSCLTMYLCGSYVTCINSHAR